MCSTTRWSEPTPPAEAPITTMSKFATSLLLQEAGRGRWPCDPCASLTVPSNERREIRERFRTAGHAPQEHAWVRFHVIQALNVVATRRETTRRCRGAVLSVLPRLSRSSSGRIQASLQLDPDQRHLVFPRS